MLAIGVAPEKALPALVAQAGENKNNVNAKEVEKIKVEFEENYVNVKGELALVGKITISSNVDIGSVYEEIKQEAKNRLLKIATKDDLGGIIQLHAIDTKNKNYIKNAYFENVSDCKIKMINKKLMDVINNFEK